MPNKPVSSAIAAPTETGVLLFQIRGYLGMDRRRFAKAINTTTGSVRAFEEDPKCRIPLRYMERAVSLLDPQTTPGDLQDLCKPITEQLEKRNFMRAEGLSKAYSAFLKAPSEGTSAHLHHMIALYLINFRLTENNTPEPDTERTTS